MSVGCFSGEAYDWSMIRILPLLLIRLSLILAIGAGLVGAGFAHRSAAPVDADLLAFIEVGGTLDDLCDDGGPITHWGDTGCEACRLSDTAHVPKPLGIPAANVLALSFDVALPVGPVMRGFDAPSDHAARAPPVV